MYKTISEVDRVTISLPHSIVSEIETLRVKLKVSRSEIFKQAVERFIDEQNRSRLQTIASEMAEEYRSNRELVFFTSLDAEDFS
ncbi:MAG: ribbon-helix-helix protein, CopG family [Desulfuromonadaceae bacterium]|nr:ribbon-helix-helix protein, CopG family [Desulfuromonadaceae bacterium]